MSVGLPVLASDCPTGGPHLIMDGAQPYQLGRTTAEETPYGYLLPIPEPGDGASGIIWEDAIVELLTDDTKRTTISSRCMRRAADFSTEGVREQWFGVLASL
jgi:glycosyltransferase involved in cell wall biosynthesis